MKDDRSYLLHIRDAISRIKSYTEAGRDSFLKDTKTQDAVVRNLAIVGEAAKRLSQELKDRHPEVPWKQIAGMRDRVIHNYIEVNLEIVWDTVERGVPELEATVAKMLAESGA